MARASLVTVSALMEHTAPLAQTDGINRLQLLFPSNDYRRALRQLYDHHRPPCFDIRIELKPDGSEDMADPAQWLRQAQKSLVSGQKTISDFFDLPGLQCVERTLPDAKGEGAGITLRFDDWTCLPIDDIADEATTTVHYGTAQKAMWHGLKNLVGHLNDKQEDIMDATLAETLSEAYLEMIVGQLNARGLIDKEDAVLSLMEAHNLDEKEASQHLVDVLEVIYDTAPAPSRGSIDR